MAAPALAPQTSKANAATPQRSAATRAPQGAAPAHFGIVRLQQSVGNRGIHRLLQTRAIQPKLTVGPVDDEYEREADSVADEIVRMPDPSVEPIAQRVSPQLQRLCPECEEEEEKEAQRTPIQIRRMCPACEKEEAQRTPDPVQRMCPECEEEAHRQPDESELQRALIPLEDDNEEADEEDENGGGGGVIQTKRAGRDPPDASAELATYVQSSRHGGQPLPQAARASFESRFGQNFGGVRVHTGTRASEAAAEINALAFTTGSDIYFGGGRFNPGTPEGDRLLAHELTHTIQQTGGRRLAPASSAAENTEGSSDSTIDASPGGDVQRTPSQTIQRMCAECEEERVQRRATDPALPYGGPVSGDTETYLQSVSYGGHPLPGVEREFFEQRFGTSFADVRLHTDHGADVAARAIGAEAFTMGTSVAFRQGRYLQGTDAGRRLLAHELTHVVHQTGRPQAPVQRTIGDGDDLTATRFAGNVTLEAAFDDELLISVSSHRRGAHVRLIQESLLAQGYTLPQFGADGIYGAETKAAVKVFQRDAGAVLIDGIVGPETMGLLDRHDTTTLAGPGPVARTGPVPGPRPAPAVGCDAPFAGVTFALAAATGTGVAPAANIRVVKQGGRDFLFMQGIAHPSYRPQITITAPFAAAATNFEAGLIQNLLFDSVIYTYTGGTQVITALPPIKDGAPLASGVYDPVFAENGGGQAGVLLPFTGTPSTVTLDLPDVPSDGAFINALDNPQCTGGQAAGRMSRGTLVDEFRTWVGVRHRPSGCVRTLHHIDWRTEFDVLILSFLSRTIPVTVTNAITVSVANGNGAPLFIQGGPVADDLNVASRRCV